MDDDGRPTGLPPSIKPNVSWKRVEPADVLTGLETLPKTLGAMGRIFGYRGQSMDTNIQWAVAELESAESASSESDAKRHATQAVGHAKRAVDALFDAYLERDLLVVHLGDRSGFAKKMELLKQRLGNSLPWRLIPAVIAAPRDEAEHERNAPSVAQAGIAVEAARIATRAMVALSDPLRGPALAGAFPGGWASGTWGNYFWMDRYPDQFAWFSRCVDGIPRAGVGVSRTKDSAEVTFANLSAFSKVQHLEMLTYWDGFNTSAWFHEDLLREKLRVVGLDAPGSTTG